MMTNKEELLMKVKALAERGEGGEATSAAALLEKLMKKYGVTEADLDDKKRENVEFRYSKPFEDLLLSQVIYMVMGDVPVYHYTKSRAKVKIVDCTKAERLEIEAAFDFYRHHLEAGLMKFYHAFVQREGLFPADSKKRADVPAREPDIEEEMLISALQKHTRHKALTETSERGPEQ